VKISVKLSREKEVKEVNLEEGSLVLDLLKKLKLKPDTIIVLKNNLPIPVDDQLKDKQILSIIMVSSGG
jgi:sulfur carrier protein ThiS